MGVELKNLGQVVFASYQSTVIDCHLSWTCRVPQQSGQLNTCGHICSYKQWKHAVKTSHSSCPSMTFVWSTSSNMVMNVSPMDIHQICRSQLWNIQTVNEICLSYCRHHITSVKRNFTLIGTINFLYLEPSLNRHTFCHTVAQRMSPAQTQKLFH